MCIRDRNITVAARQGGDNPDYNPALKQAIDKAKADNMPNDNIDRAIKKATGEGAGDDFQRVIYEGYGPAGVAVIVDCLTDNVQRTAPDVRHAFDKNGGNLGTDGSVMFMFDHKGEILVNNKDKDFDEFMMDALEAGADDVIEEDEFFEAITSVEAFNEAVAKLEESGYKIERSEISYIPQNEVEVSSEHHPSLTKLIDTLEDNDDVQEVYTNWYESSEEE